MTAVWSAEMDESLVDRIAAGVSLSKIGIALGKTKNACVGRWHRIRCRDGIPPMKPATVKSVPEPERQDFPPIGHCLHSTDTNTPYHWCGMPTGSLSLAWCATHAALVYQPMPKKAATE